ncbi:glycosyltransferase family 4 protein [Qipengyuania gaetbuli]|uniref:glycosyltransferase family 4 protein n=1 Tax=Qipengyuania gaetbuli TaxID=266952 RepID=UPI001CD4F6BA|nr:glycosyltransferase family 4 protein [Qipengyuania gaetbuli]MCA0911031.1 glycosyltransferase family 4 protein [Qipengyuania gaetbuli]
MKVLISAYACETGRGSEGEIGWRVVHELAKRHDVTVITRANLRKVHDQAFARTPKPARLQFEYLDLPWIFRFYKKGKRFFLIYYYLWQIGVAFRARKVLRRQHVDVVHHLTGGMDWMPSGLAFGQRPFVWGPVGSENTHPQILKHLSVRSKLKDLARVFMRSALRTFDPFTRLTARRAKIILSHTSETLPPRYAPKIVPFPQTAITDTSELALSKLEAASYGPMKLLFVGELKDWKGARLALEAALKFFDSNKEARLIVVGDGPLKKELITCAEKHPEGDRVTFLGRVPMDVVVKNLNEADVFLYPSFHHGLATIVLQAMLSGLPTVCIEGDATGRAIGSSAGITVSLAPDRSPADDLAVALSKLAADESFRRRLGRNARELAVSKYTYDKVSERLSAAYESVLKEA